MGPAAAFCGWAHSLAYLQTRGPNGLLIEGAVGGGRGAGCPNRLRNAGEPRGRLALGSPHLQLRRPHPLFGDQPISNLQKSHQTLSPRTRKQRGLDLLLYVPANSEAAALSASVYVAEA